MTFAQLAKDRYSVRGFLDKPIGKEKLDSLLLAAQAAPTACNKQPQRIYVLQSPGALAKAAKCTSFTFGAPIIILVCYDADEVWTRSYDGHGSGDIDASIVTTHIMMEAAELGLGSTWVGCFDPRAVKDLFALPRNIIPVAMLPIGFPDAAASKAHTSRKPLEETVTYL